MPSDVSQGRKDETRLLFAQATTRYSDFQAGAHLADYPFTLRVRTASMLWQERIESLKAGLWGAIAVGLAAIVFSWIEAAAWPELRFPGIPAGGIMASLPWQSLGWAIAALSGFLFAVTYRYVIRQDPSSHLRSGAVLAFGLVRGLAQVDMAWLLQGELLLPLFLLGESLAMMAIARFWLDLGLSRGWLQPFKGFE